MIATLVQIYDSLLMVQSCLYFMYVSKDWFYLHLGILALNIIACALCFLLPESPQFLYRAHRFEEAREIFRIIAKINKKDERAFSYLFDKEVDAKNSIHCLFSTGAGRSVGRAVS